jgi:hypothetical protein
MVVDGNTRLVGGRQTADREVRREADLPLDDPKLLPSTALWTRWGLDK